MTTRTASCRCGQLSAACTCGGTIAYTIEALPGLTAVPVGAFADPHFPAPTFSVYQERKHAWVEINGTVEQFD